MKINSISAAINKSKYIQNKNNKPCTYFTSKAKPESTNSSYGLSGKIKDTYKNFKRRVEDFLDDVAENLDNTEFLQKTSNGEKRLIKITGKSQYDVYDSGINRIGSMNIGVDSIEQMWCDDSFYKNARKGSIIINNVYGKDEETENLLIQEAIKKSKKLGLEGRIITYAYSTDRNYAAPVPFYNKKGFIAFKPEIQRKIETGMENLYSYGEYTGPKATYMYLPKEKINEYLSKH